jgi:hypothetical protein
MQHPADPPRHDRAQNSLGQLLGGLFEEGAAESLAALPWHTAL